MLWPLFGGRSEYLKAPKLKALKHWLRHQARQQREKELANQKEGADIRDVKPENLPPHPFAHLQQQQ